MRHSIIYERVPPKAEVVVDIGEGKLVAVLFTEPPDADHIARTGVQLMRLAQAFQHVQATSVIGRRRARHAQRE